MMAKVYVSSTIADLQRERQAVMEWLVAAGHQPVHSYRPNSESVRDSCLDDVETCDLYVLILGHRYGFQPPQDNPGGLAITHLEFRRAGQSGIPRIALLRTSIPDVSVSDMEDPQKAARVLAFREEVGHEVRPALFHDKGGLIQELSTGVQGELAKRSATAVGVGRALRLALPPTLLVGREDLLTELDGRLAGDQGSGPQIVALHGLGGAGKTSVALAYAHRHLAEVGIAWQFAAEDSAVLAAEFGELAVQLGVIEGGDPVASVHTILATYPAGWLLIFDNAPGWESVETFLPPAGDGRVLITSRNALWPRRQAAEVPVLDLDVAAGFLVARTGDADHQAAVALAEAVGGLPLALEQAAAYIEATGDSLAGYRASFQKRRADLLARGQPTGYRGTVAAALALAFTQLEESVPEAPGLLRLLAFCAPEAIPLGLLLQPRPGLAEELSPEVAGVLTPLLADELVVKDAVAALRRYSLVRPARDGAVSVHRVVQAVTADQMPDGLRAAWRRAVATLIESAIPADTMAPDTWPTAAKLLSHAQAVLDPDSRGMILLAGYLRDSGSPAAARDLYQRILDTQERVLGPDHPQTLVTRDRLANSTWEAGSRVAARDQYEALLTDRERVLGPDHPDTLVVRVQLAYFAGLLGDEICARDQFAELLADYERIFGPEAPETVRCRGNLAWWTGEAGDAAAARDHYAALLADRERMLGPDHPDTLATRDSLAWWTGRAGDAAAARDQHAALLADQERVLGPDHPQTLRVRYWLADWIGRAGDAAAARDHYAALLADRERVLGPDHPDTLATHDSLAWWTGRAGDAAAARDQHAALLADQERVLGPDHPDTLATRDSLAYWTKKADEDAEPGVE